MEDIEGSTRHQVIKLLKVFCLLCIGNDLLTSCSGAISVDGEPIMCKDNEREALLTLKQGLTNMSSYSPTDLLSWGSAKHKMECCNWDGVECSNTTGHVIGLRLHGLRGEISPALLELIHLNSLDLYSNDFGGNKIPEFIGSLDKLESLDLHDNNFSGDVPYQLGNLTNLKELYLSYNSLTCKDLSCLSWISNLTLLSVVELNDNQLEGTIFPDLKALSSLTRLFLDHNNLTGSLPTSIGQLSSLQILSVSHNSLQGTISDDHFLLLHNLTYLDLSYNSLDFNFTLHWIPPFQLDTIRLAGCNVGPGFPSWIQTQTRLGDIDLSSSGISDQVPSWFWNHSSVNYNLNLSHNGMSGSIPEFSDEFSPWYFDLSFNNFSGPLPSIHSDINLRVLDLSNNMFSGTIHPICRMEHYSLQILDLSNNQLSGDLSNCFENTTNLAALNLAENKFDGHIPPSLGSVVSLETLILRSNSLSGEFPSALSRCDQLILIDCGGNSLTGHVPTWMGSLSKLVFLLLGQNNFYGSIPPEICRLSLIQVLDLSDNNISGTIPRCFRNFTSLTRTNESVDVETLSLVLSVPPNGDFHANNVIVRWKRQVSEYKNTLRLLKLIDLSSNNLVGNIPPEISLLAGLVSLNLSQNHFTGGIISEIGQMEMLEILDLSRNNLSGGIPQGLAELNFLSVLDLSRNNLSGKIPQGTQLKSFDASDFAENKELCGQPLPNCPEDNPPPSLPGAVDEQKDGEFNLIQSLIEDYFISAIIGYIVAFWVTIGPLLFKRSWRNAYFGYLNMFGDWLYVTVSLSWRRLARCMKSRD